jgi:hypothetical protein
VDHTKQDPAQAARKEMVHPGAMGIANGAMGIAKGLIVLNLLQVSNFNWQ